MEPDVCSAKGCRAPAEWQLLWNNPKLHDTDRRKTWLACEVHRGSLESFLAARGFLKETLPHVLDGPSASPAPHGPPSGSPATSTDNTEPR